MNGKDIYSIREWAPMSHLMDTVPVRVQRGFFPVELSFTCVDAVAEFIALGSNVGITFWYNRKTGDLQKLKSEVASPITCVKIVNSVEYMVAAGNSTGQVNVFQIQKEIPPDLNLIAPCTRNKPIERYTIKDMHNSAVSCCCWSKNSMKLYSGNRQGVVVLTEFDYQEHISKSIEILRESYEIVQISVSQSYLLVSSLYRAIICQRSISTGQWQIIQVGKKDRKLLTDCGGIFLRKQNQKRPIAICGRPGLRLWISDTDGNVEKTMLFKELLTRSNWEIPILNPRHNFHSKQPKMFQSSNDSTVATKNFRNLIIYPGNDSLVVTHDDQDLYILNIDRLRVEAIAKGFRKIIDFCVCDNEIFVLEGERSLIRLAPAPEKPNKTAKIIFNPLLPPPVPLLGNVANGEFESPIEYETIVSGEEVFELPPIETLNLNIPIELAVESPRAEQSRRMEIFNQIAEMEFDQSILHHSGTPRSKRKSRDHTTMSSSGAVATGIVEIGHDANVAEKLPKVGEQNKEIPKVKPIELTTKPISMDASFCDETKSTTETNPFAPYLPQLPTPTTLQKTIEEKAKILAEELNLPTMSIEPTNNVKKVTNKNASGNSSGSSVTISTQTPSPEQIRTPTFSLSDAYPQQNAVCQSTPRKKVYYIQNTKDYSDGHPVDDIFQELRSTTLVETVDDQAMLSAAKANIPNQTQSTASLRYVPTKPLCEEIDSFLLNFPHERKTRRQSTTPSTESNTSSEWEFLDN